MLRTQGYQEVIKLFLDRGFPKLFAPLSAKFALYLADHPVSDINYSEVDYLAFKEDTEQEVAKMNAGFDGLDHSLPTRIYCCVFFPSIM